MKTAVLKSRHLVLWLSLLVSVPSWAQTETLRVGVAECPPFVIFEDGSYSGLAVYLWEEVGRELGLEWQYEEYPLGSLLEVIRTDDRSLMPDLGISCTSVTSEREQWIDFPIRSTKPTPQSLPDRTRCGQPSSGFSVIRA